MNFNHLLIFQKVAEKQHFTRAAEELFISQPAVSKQIAELEKQLGQPLFAQVGRKIHLTEAGQILYDYATRIFALSTEAETILDELHGLKRGRLAVGASTTIG
ncbi:MAG: LysR family transcriptional regulator, partial [Ktedonobacteraceae bacterium]|nr:LysR family transcriptional regulator [Ktedonobacteraceae bacterium]